MYVYLRAATTPGASVMFYWYHVDDAHDTCGPIDDNDDPGNCEDFFVPGTPCASIAYLFTHDTNIDALVKEHAGLLHYYAAAGYRPREFWNTP